jgi:hypothetical protein
MEDFLLLPPPNNEISWQPGVLVPTDSAVKFRARDAGSLLRHRRRSNEQGGEGGTSHGMPRANEARPAHKETYRCAAAAQPAALSRKHTATASHDHVHTLSYCCVVEEWGVLGVVARCC